MEVNMALFNNKKNQSSPERDNMLQLLNNLKNTSVFKTIDENFNFINGLLGTGIDLVEDKYDIMGGSIKAGLVFIDSISDKPMIRQHLILPLITSGAYNNSPDNTLAFIKSRIIAATSSAIAGGMDKVIEKLLSGETIIFLEGASSALIASSRKVEKKAIETPENERTVLGSQESFTDDIKTNIGTILKRLPTPLLHAEEFSVGTLSHTKVKLLWLNGIAKQSLIDDVKSRVQKIKIDNVDGIGNLAEMIEDNPSSIFPKYKQTERPDITVGMLSEGRVAIICENSPFTLIAPFSFWDNFKTMDDYEDRSTTASYLRVVRFIAFFLSILISPLYLSFVTYNHAIVPPTLALNIASGREGVPFPSVVELLLLSLAMSVIREAGLRMPSSVGYFVSTLAAVLIGQAIVQAGYVSASLTIVVAVSTISSFATSSTTLVYTSRLLNYFLILLSGAFGMFGLINGLIIIFWRLVKMQSFGIPYLSPVLPLDMEGIKDTFIRPNLSVLKKKKNLQGPENNSAGK